MSHPSTSKPHLPDIDPDFGLIFDITEQLIPLFAISAGDVPLARRMAISAIEAYEPETRADYVNIARTIAFSMSALALLGQAAAKDMPITEKMKAFSRANALNRSADQSERTMMRRRVYRNANAGQQTDSDQAAPSPSLDNAVLAEALRIHAAANPPQPEPKAASPARPTAPAPTIRHATQPPAVHQTQHKPAQQRYSVNPLAEPAFAAQAAPRM